MSLCVFIDGAGIVAEAVGETPPACSEFLLLSPVEASKLTYWADLAIQLEPGGDVFGPLVGAMVLAFGTVLGARLVVKNLRTLSNEE